MCLAAVGVIGSDSGPRRKGNCAGGRFAAFRWAREGDQLPEVLIAREGLKREGPEPSAPTTRHDYLPGGEDTGPLHTYAAVGRPTLEAGQPFGKQAPEPGPPTSTATSRRLTTCLAPPTHDSSFLCSRVGDLEQVAVWVPEVHRCELPSRSVALHRP